MIPSTSKDKSTTSFAAEPGDLLARTLRMVLILVGACVLFVGVLSVGAVLITNKAMGTSGQKAKAVSVEVEDSSPAAPKKPAPSPPRGAPGPHPI